MKNQYNITKNLLTHSSHHLIFLEIIQMMLVELLVLTRYPKLNLLMYFTVYINSFNSNILLL